MIVPVRDLPARLLLTHMRPMGLRLLEGALRVVYPERCPLCGGRPRGLAMMPICEGCFGRIAEYTGSRCYRCGETMASEHASGECGACISRKRHVLSSTRYYGLYEGALRQAVHELKFHNRRAMADPLAGILSGVEIHGWVDGLVPVPSGPGGLRRRGYSHTHVLGLALYERMGGERWGVEPLWDALLKHRDTPPQVGLNRSERLVNLRGAFSVRGGLKGRRLLLLDDVITTGATVRECARELRKAGAREVHALALAKTSSI